MDIPNLSQGPHYVYTLSYPDSMGGTVFYIGKGTGRRIYIHEWEVKNDKLPEKYNRHKVNVIRKIHGIGKQVAKTKVAFFETHQEACMYEIALIFLMDGLTNLTDGGEGTIGRVCSDETLQKIKTSCKRRWEDEENRKMASEVQKKLWEDEEYRHRMSEAQKGHLLSAEGRRKLIEANTGRIQPEEERRKRSASAKGKVRSEEHQRKLNIAAKNRSPEWRQKQSDARRGKPFKSKRENKETSCKACGQTIAPFSAPREKIYCNQACKYRYYKARKAGKDLDREQQS